MSDVRFSTKYYPYPETTRELNTIFIQKECVEKEWNIEERKYLKHDKACLYEIHKSDNYLENIFRLVLQAYFLKDKYECLLEIYDIHIELLKNGSKWTEREIRYFKSIISRFKNRTSEFQDRGIDADILWVWNKTIQSAFVLQEKKYYILNENERDRINKQKIIVNSTIRNHFLFKKLLYEFRVDTHTIYTIISYLRNRTLEFINPFEHLNMRTEAFERESLGLPYSIINGDGRLIFDAYITKLGFNTVAKTNIANFFIDVHRVVHSGNNEETIGKEYSNIWPRNWCKCDYPSGKFDIQKQYQHANDSLAFVFENIKNANLINLKDYINREIQRRREIDYYLKRKIISKYDIFEGENDNDKKIIEHSEKEFSIWFQINLFNRNLIKEKIKLLQTLSNVHFWCVSNPFWRTVFQSYATIRSHENEQMKMDFKLKTITILSQIDTYEEIISKFKIGKKFPSICLEKLKDIMNEKEITKIKDTMTNNKISGDTIHELKILKSRCSIDIGENLIFREFITDLMDSTTIIKKIIFLVHNIRGDSYLH